MRSAEEKIRDILDAIQSIEKYAAEGKARFDSDELVQTWIVHHLQIIGEAARRLKEVFREQNPKIPWAELIAMRNILVHEYFGIDLETVWRVVERDLPHLKKSLEASLEEGYPESDTGAERADL